MYGSGLPPKRLKALETAAVGIVVVKTERKGQDKGCMALFVGKVEGLRSRDLDSHQPLASRSRSSSVPSKRWIGRDSKE